MKERNRMKTRIKAGAFAAAVTLPGLLLATPAATAEDPKPVGDLTAFAVQPTCNSGKLHINAAEGVTWTVEGVTTEVTAPSSEFSYFGGLQGEVSAHALPGYVIPEGVQSSFMVQVNPSPCLSSTREPVTTQDARVDRLQARVERLRHRVHRLRTHVRHLRHRR